MTEIIIPIITGIVCLAVGVVIGFLYRKSVAEKAIGDAETEATRIINEAIKDPVMVQRFAAQGLTPAGTTPDELPAAGVHGRRATRWLLDVEAAAELSPRS